MPLKNRIAQFAHDTRGNFALTFGVAFMPVMLAAGLTVDYTNAVSTRAQLQNALDAAAIAAGVDDDLTEEERLQIGIDHFSALVAHMNIDPQPVFAISDTVISASITVDEPTLFAGLVGQSSIGITVGTEIQYSVESGAEVALVLDYSGSMGWNNKWSTMRDAAKDLIDILGEDGARDDISFALAPFSSLVHLSLPSQFVVGQPANQTWTGCTQDRKFPHNVTDNTPAFNNNATKWGLTPSSSNAQCASHIGRGLTVRPLTNDHDQVKTWLDGMTPAGNTHISLGMSIGWHLISPNAPFSEGVAYNDEAVKKFIVLLTDGAQTSPAWRNGNSHNVSNGEWNLEDLCGNVKDENVHVVTIAFDLANGPTKTRLRNCATNAGYFFEANSNAELADAFQTVAALIQGSLHISQ